MRYQFKIIVSFILVILLNACGSSGGGGGDSGQGGNSDTSTSQYVYIDAFQFSGTSNYCCWTDWFYALHGSNFFNSDASSGDPSYARGAPDGKYAIMRTPNPGFLIITGTDAKVQDGIKVYIIPNSPGIYEVWGGNSIPTSLCSYGYPSDTCDLRELGYNPQNYGYTCLGSSNITQEFLGTYLYYIVKTGSGCGAIKSLISISVTPANAAIALGATLQYMASGTYSDGRVQNITSFVTWASSSTSVASINNTGLATAISPGITTITATSGNISGTTTLFVTSNGGGPSVWLEDWKTAPIGDKPNGSIFNADAGQWSTYYNYHEKLQCNYSSVPIPSLLTLYAQAFSSITHSDCPLLSMSQVTHSTAPNSYLMTKNTKISGNWIFEIDKDIGDQTKNIEYNVEGVIWIVLPSDDFMLFYSHEKSVSLEFGTCYSPAIPNSPRCINVPDNFERNIFADFETLYGDRFVQWYNDNKNKAFISAISIVNYTYIESCPSEDWDQCKYYVKSMLTVDKVEITESQ